ncbi:hypothetical protein IKP85_05155 [bacterium]|nr:hypothetical protein [bacterium]
MSGYVRFLILILVVFIGVWLTNTFNPALFTKENMEETFKKEKTINAVQKGREQRRLEAEKVMDQF